MSEQRPGVPLLDHFLARLGGAVHTARDVLDLPGLEALTQHRWPGNAEELETVAQVARNLGISRVTLYRWLDQLSPE